jgi:FkbM family methyltransferase
MQPEELCRILEEQYFGENMHERDEIELLPSFLDGVRTFVDVGASLGQYAHFAGRTIKGGRIVCIEADPVRAERLRELAAGWEKDSGNRYEVIHAAAADQPGKMEFHLTDQNISGALLSITSPDPSQREKITWSKTEVDVVTLDGAFADG